MARVGTAQPSRCLPVKSVGTPDARHTDRVSCASALRFIVPPTRRAETPKGACARAARSGGINTVPSIRGIGRLNVNYVAHFSEVLFGLGWRGGLLPWSTIRPRPPPVEALRVATARPPRAAPSLAVLASAATAPTILLVAKQASESAQRRGEILFRGRRASLANRRRALRASGTRLAAASWKSRIASCRSPGTASPRQWSLPNQ